MIVGVCSSAGYSLAEQIIQKLFEWHLRVCLSVDQGVGNLNHMKTCNFVCRDILTNSCHKPKSNQCPTGAQTVTLTLAP